jgi:hypothetical protein
MELQEALLAAGVREVHGMSPIRNINDAELSAHVELLQSVTARARNAVESNGKSAKPSSRKSTRVPTKEVQTQKIATCSRSSTTTLENKS